MDGQDITTQEPAEIYDMDKGAYVPNPNFKQDEPEPSDDDDPVDDTPDSDDEPADDEPDTDGEPDTDDEPEDEPSDDDEPGPDDEPTDDEPEEDILDPDDYIKNTYGEKYGLNNQKELEDLIDGSLSVQDKYEALQKEYEALKETSGKPKFSSDKQQKAFEFLSQFDVDRQGEALDTFAKLIAMDVEKADEMLVLEERFIHEHPEWSRHEAQRMFKKEFTRKYTLNKDDFDSEEEYKSELEDMAIMKKGEVQRARNFLKEKQTTYKPKPEEEKPKDVVPEAITKSIEQNATVYGDFVSKSNEVVFEHGEDKYTFKLDADKKSEVAKAVEAWVKNPRNYGKDGKLLGVSDPKRMMNVVAVSLYMDDILDAITDQVKNNLSIKRVDEIAKHKPKKRQSPGSGELKKGGDELIESARMLMKKRQAAR